MKKEEFIKKLREKLSILEEKEIEDIVAEYTGYIEEKMQKGATEEEAIKDFGSIEELTKELLEAYKINVNQNNYEKNWITKLTDSILSLVDQLIQFFSNKTANEIIKIIFEIIMILVLICLCKIPFLFLEDVGHNIFMITKSDIGYALFHIWETIIELIYIIFAVILFAKIFEKRYLTKEKKIEIQTEEPKKASKKQNTLKSIEKEEKTEKIIVEKHTGKGVLDLLSTACLYFIKFLVFWIEVGVSCFLLAMGICLGISIFLIIKGVSYYGTYLSILILLIIGILTFIVFFNFLFNRKNNVRFLLTSFILCFIALGLTFSAVSIEVATTEFINQPPIGFKEEHITKTLPMDLNYIIQEHVEYIEDETHTDEILIDFSYFPDFYTINPKIEQEKNQIYLIRNYSQTHWNSKMIDTIINDLKNKKIYNYSMFPEIKIYTSKENINILKENHRKWYIQNNYFDRYNNEIEEGYDI